MTRVLIDSSVFFSAAYSSRGHARDLIQMATRGEIDLVLSRIVIEETSRNLAESAPEATIGIGAMMAVVLTVRSD